MTNKIQEITAPKMIVNGTGLDMFRIFGNIGIAEIWFPPYITKMAPTRTEGAATPIKTPAELDTAIMDRLIANDWVISFKTASGTPPMLK